MLERLRDNPIADLIKQYIFFTPRSEQKERDFETYIKEISVKFFHVYLWGLLAALTLPWPTDFILFSDPALIEMYQYWRVIGAGLAIGYLIDINYIGYTQNHPVQAILYGHYIFIAMTSALFSTVRGPETPWFNVIYSTPLCTIIIPIKKYYNRFFATLALPIIYQAAFILTVPDYIDWPYHTATAVLCFYYSLMATLIGHLFYRLIRTGYFKQQELDREKTKSDNLLRNILPEQIADRLKDGEEVADRHNNVTVLFADIVGFTSFSEQLPPQQVVNILDEIFTNFDNKLQEYNLEKIKTIGDEYMCVGGLRANNKKGAQAAVQMALDMQKIIKKVNLPDEVEKDRLQLRVGLHTGPCVAGIIGEDKFSYDIWGDTVNTASRMEESASAGEIQITADTYRALSNYQNYFDKKRDVNVKGKSSIEVMVNTGN